MTRASIQRKTADRGPGKYNPAGTATMKRLVIVESPAKARTLQPMLGAGYIVRASMGHVRDLPSDALGVDVENDFRPTYHLLRQKGKTIKALRAALEEAGEVYLATDPDREGEAIAWHLLQALKPRDRTIRRVTFHEITPGAIQAAFAQPRAGLDMHLVNAQQARRVLDRLVGYQVSPLLWKTTGGKSAGRVQSVALRLVVERERDIRNFVPQEYWSIHAQLKKIDDCGLTIADSSADLVNRQPSIVNQTFVARLSQVGNRQVGLGKPICLNTKAAADRVIAALAGATWRVKRIKRETKTRKPWPPFTTSTLQQSASARLGMAPAETMKIAQALYEGVDIGAGKPTGLITYMRTDSTAVSPEAQAAARQVVESTLGSRYLPDTPPAYKTKVKNAQEAHEAIRPTDVTRYPSALKERLTPRQWKLYDLIWRRFVASQMAPAVYSVTTVDVEATASHDGTLTDRSGEEGDITASPLPPCLFRAVGRDLVFDGFLRVWQEEDAPDDEDEPQTLPLLSKGELLELIRLFGRQHFTQPPPRYTEAALIKALEDRGIGRPSTYASIVGTLKDRAYVTLEKRQLAPTPVGESTCDALVAAFPDEMDYGFTAQVEDWLDDISRGDRDWVDALRAFYAPFSKALSEARDKMRTAAPPRPAAASASGDTPTSDAAEDGKPRRRGRFTRRPRRRAAGATAGATARAKAGPSTTHDTPTITCPLCGAPMVKRTSQYGAFWGCSKYPACRGTRRIGPADQAGLRSSAESQTMTP